MHLLFIILVLISLVILLLPKDIITKSNEISYEVIKEKTYGKVSIFVLGKELVWVKK